MVESCKNESNPAYDAMKRSEAADLATTSKINQKNPLPSGSSDKSFEEELIKRVTEIRLVRESLSATSSKRKNKKIKSRKNTLKKRSVKEEIENPEGIEKSNTPKRISEYIDSCELNGSSDSDNESCDYVNSEKQSQASLKQKHRRRRKRSKKKVLTVEEISLNDPAIVKTSTIDESLITDLNYNFSKLFLVDEQPVKEPSNLDLKQVFPSQCKGKKQKKKMSGEWDDGQKASDKNVVAKTKEVKGSYSQLLEEVEKPLLYQPVDEIVLLLSPMAQRGAHNQMDYQHKNCNNPPYNKQNYRPLFKQSYPPSPNGILGHAPHNFTPMYKMSNQAQQHQPQPPPPLLNNQINNVPYKPQDIEEQVKNNPNLIIGEIRINPKDYKDCYIPHPDGHSDIYICGTKNRNSALNGDRVLVLLNDKTKWKVNKKELDSNFTSESDDNEGIEQLLANTSLTENDPAAKDAKPGEVSSCSMSPQPLFNKDGPPITCRETPDETGAIANVDVNLKRTPQKKDLSVKKYTSVGDLNQDVDLQKVLEDQNKDMYIQRTGKVLSILEEKHPRKCVGHLGPTNNKKVRFNPIDSRIPRLSIPLSECPKEYLQRPEDFSRVLFVAKILNQSASGSLTQGSLLQRLGEAGDIETETQGILIENDIDDSEFPDSVLSSLPIDLDRPWTVSKEEYSKRRDLTNQCIFTIDPSSARDLDDAVSCEVLEDQGLYEVGVHIADVSYFLKEATNLDKIAASRATSVYLTQKVIPMLPQILCEKLCSLNPNEPRLTFSVIWQINNKGEIVNEWFGRSIIKSCAKLSYDHAQGFIDDPTREYTKEQLPNISRFSLNDIKSRVLNLHKIACLLRNKRFEDGALRLDQVKLQWLLNDETYLPMGYFVYERKDSNQLIEEFMLLANMAVAHRIHKSFPEKCLLRRHPEPQTRMIDSLNDFCKTTNIDMDISSAGAIHKSLLQYTDDDDDEYSLARLQVLIAKCSKPMKLAQYFCSGTITDKNEYRHYALNVPLYTHFTSPIRRYADVIVHRLLAAALSYTPPIQQSAREMEKQAQHCNDKKTASKRAQELSCEIFLAAFIQASGPLYEKGMVMAILNHAFDVYILRLGVVKRVYCNKLDLHTHTAFKRKKLPMLRLHWKENDHMQEIGIFTLVKCILKTDTEPLKWMATITHPQL